MTGRPHEVTEVHTRLLKCALEIGDARSYWAHAGTSSPATAERAFTEFWFGARSRPRIDVLLANMKARFDAFPPALDVLGGWSDMSPDTRRVICHWHLQLADPLYRVFTGEWLVTRRSGHRPEVTRDLVLRWVTERGHAHWTMATRIQFASKLLSAAYSAGVVGRNRDPRPVVAPRVPDDALEYLLYLLRGVEFEGTLLRNSYHASVGLDEGTVDARLRALPGVTFSRQGDLVEFDWRYPDLRAWADATRAPREAQLARGR